MKWKRKLKEVFLLKGGMKSQVPLNRRAQVDKMLDEEETPSSRLDERTMQEGDDPGPVNTPLQRRRSRNGESSRRREDRRILMIRTW